MILDHGTLEVCETANRATPGRMPKNVIVSRFPPVFYGELNIGYRRQYAAMGVSQQVDKLVRIWQDRRVHIGMVAILDGAEQYRIDNVQHLEDENLEPVTHLTLRRLDTLYDIDDET